MLDNHFRALAHVGKNLRSSVFWTALAEREEANRSGKMTVCLRTLHLYNNKKHSVFRQLFSFEIKTLKARYCKIRNAKVQ